MNKEDMDKFIQRANLMGNGEAISEMVNDNHIIITKEDGKYHVTIWFAHNALPIHNEYFETAIQIEAFLRKLHYIYY